MATDAPPLGVITLPGVSNAAACRVAGGEAAIMEADGDGPGRDWTCPMGGPWRLSGQHQIVAVICDADVALARTRDLGLEAGSAATVVEAYARRLRALRDAVEFRVIDLSADDAAGDWTGHGAWHSADIAALQRYAETDVESPPIDTATVESVLAGVVDPEPLDRYCGPSAVARHDALCRLAGETGARVVAFTRRINTLARAAEPSADERTLWCYSLRSFERAMGHLGEPVGAIALIDALSWCRRSDLRQLLEQARAGLHVGGTLVIGDSVADRETRASIGLPPIADRDLRRAARRSGFADADVSDDGIVRGHRFMARAPRRVEIGRWIGDATDRVRERLRRQRG